MAHDEVPRETDDTDIVIVDKGGRLFARASKGAYAFEEELPHGIETWTQDEVAAHFKRFVAPILKTKITRAIELKERAPELLAEVDRDVDRQVVKVMRAEMKRERKKLCLTKT